MVVGTVVGLVQHHIDLSSCLLACSVIPHVITLALVLLSPCICTYMFMLDTCDVPIINACCYAASRVGIIYNELATILWLNLIVEMKAMMVYTFSM